MPDTCDSGSFVTVHTVNISVQYSISGATADEISASVEAGVRERAPAPGETLPTVRALAAQLEVSPTTVAASYRELTRRGIVIGRGQARHPRPRRAADLGTPAARGAAWRPRSAHRRARSCVAPGSARLSDPLREGLAAYGESPVSSRLASVATGKLAEEGVDASNIAVVGGALDGVERVLGSWLRPGDRVAVEDPGYTAVLDLLAALGLRLVPVGMDERGAIPERLEDALERGVAAAVLTPRAQNPTGAAWDTAARPSTPRRARPPRRRARDRGRSRGTGCGRTAEHDLRRPFQVGDDPFGLQVARPRSQAGGAGGRCDDREQGRGSSGTRHRVGSATCSRRRSLPCGRTHGLRGTLDKAASVYALRREALIGALRSVGDRRHIQVGPDRLGAGSRRARGRLGPFRRGDRGEPRRAFQDRVGSRRPDRVRCAS